ncbi:TPA: tyrosine-type recombinase/integrase [Legionella pneumophila]|nr:tyrosine-type recombinase/integrase [Legionella pneumophila]
MNLLGLQNDKNPKFVIDKISSEVSVQFDTNSLKAWLGYYYEVHVRGAPLKTEQAKMKDLTKFIQFFEMEVGNDHVDSWTPAVSKQFQKSLTNTISPRTNKPYKATTVNRTMATIRHVGRWLNQHRPLLAGDPLAQVKDVQVDSPDWNGLTSRQLMRLKSACEQRIKSCTRKNQNPLLEAAIFYTLLGSGLRASELVSLNVYQYERKGLSNVIRHKSKRVTGRVPLPIESRQFIEQYLEQRKAGTDEPLFITRYNTRLKTLDVYRSCQRLLKQALAFLPDEDRFEFTPHKLRHTFLKRVTDKHGVHFAQEVSGNVSIKEIFRYAKPSEEELQKTIESLF